MKTCKGCNQTKALTEFHKESKGRNGLKSRCKVCKNAYFRKYRQNNLEKKRASQRKSQQRPEYKKKRRARENKRYHTDPQYRLAKKLSSRLRKALKGKTKSARTMKLVGCSIAHLQDHLEKQFQPGMTWENHGKWHVDHMMPCASFDLTDPEQQRQCCHYTNLQPLWATENISKNAKVIYNRVWNGFRWVDNA